MGLKTRADVRLQLAHRKIERPSTTCDRDNVGDAYGSANRNSLQCGIPFEQYAGKERNNKDYRDYVVKDMLNKC